MDVGCIRYASVGLYARQVSVIMPAQLARLQGASHARGPRVNSWEPRQRNIRMIELVNDQILVIKLIRTDTTLDLSQKAEKV